MGLISRLLGSNKALDVADNAINKIGGGLDQLFYSKEEQSEHALKLYEFWLETQKTTANESSVRSVTRRIIAVAITFNYLALLNAIVVLYILDKTMLADKVKETMMLLNTPFASVVLFYLGYYGASKIIDHIKGKKD
jgi:hypothetical protein